MASVPEALTLLTQARKDEVDLGYHEPPAFIQPVAEFEAGVLLKAGQKTEAEKAWKQALEDRHNSGYPLFGLAEMGAQARVILPRRAPRMSSFWLRGRTPI